MAKKCFPYPDELETRSIIRKNQASERLKRMTEQEESLWKQEAYKISMKEMIDQGVKPTFLVINARILSKSIDCDILFNSIILGKNE